MPTFYKGNDIDTTSKDELSKQLINKIVRQKINMPKAFRSVFGVFDKTSISSGFQEEEIEFGDLTEKDFDPTGAGVLTKEDLKVKAIYHKINRDKQYKATVSNKQIRRAMLSKENTADIANGILATLTKASTVADYEAMKTLLKDICGNDGQKNMTICDLNENGNDINSVVKAIKTLATKMTFPSSNFNYLGYNKQFNEKDELVLIIDAETEAILDVDSLAVAFNMEKRSLVENIIVIDSMPDINYAGLATTKVGEIGIGSAQPIAIHKYNSLGEETVTGKVKGFLVSKQAIIHEVIDRDTDYQKNAEGRFTNYFLNAEDMLSYSPLKNAIVFVD